MGETWTQAERQLHINTLELIEAELEMKTLTREIGFFNSHPDGQHSSLMLFHENGGNRKLGTQHNIETNMTVPCRREVTLTEWIPTQLNV